MSITGPKTALALCLLALVFLVACDDGTEMTTSGVEQKFNKVLTSNNCNCIRNGGDFIPEYCSNRADITFADLGINQQYMEPPSAKAYPNPTALCKDASFNNHVISQTRVTTSGYSDAKAYCRNLILFIPNCGDVIHPNCESSANAELQAVVETRVKDCAHSGVTFTEQAAGQASSTASSEPASSEPASSEPASSEPASSEPASSEPASSESVGSLTDLEQDQAAEKASSEPASSEPASSEPASCASDSSLLASEAACCPVGEIFESFEGKCISSLAMIDGGPVDDSGGSGGATEESEETTTCPDGQTLDSGGAFACIPDGGGLVVDSEGSVGVIEESEEDPEPATCSDGQTLDSAGGCISDL